MELLVAEDQEKTTVDFFATIDRHPEDPDPYIRRDGSTDPLGIVSILRTAQRRTNWIQYERTAAGIHYLVTTITAALKLLPIDSQQSKQLQQELQTQLKARNWTQAEQNSASV